VKEHFNGYFVAAVVELWERAVGLIRPLESYQCRHLQCKGNLVTVCQGSTFGAAPESVEIQPTDAGQEESVLRISRIRISTMELPEDAQVALEWHQ
jgi:hypothetical protein